MDGGRNSKLADSSKQIISFKAKERYRDKTKNPMYGKKHTEETIEKMRLAKTGDKNPMFGRKVSKETIEKRNKTIRDNNISLSHEWTDEEKKKARIRMLEMADKWRKKVLCLEDNNIFASITEAAKYYNVAISTLSGHLNGYQHSCAGHHFKFID